MKTADRRHQQGSILIVVLILMMVTVSLALYAVSLSRDCVATSRQLLDNLQCRLESGSVIEKIKYLGAIGRFGPSYLESVSVNKEFPLQMNIRGEPITVGNSEVRLIDSGGRCGLWPPNPEMVKRMVLAGGGSPEEGAVAADSLLDWVDADDLKHLNGAESFYYQSDHSLGYLPRNNPFIQMVGELELIRGFRGKVFELVKGEIVETVSGKINYNTADPLMLAALLNIGADRAASLVRLRNIRGFITEAEILAQTGNNLTLVDEYITSVPSMTLAVDIRTRIGDAGDAVNAIISFKPGREKAFVVEKYSE